MELTAVVGMCALSLALGVGGTRAIFGAMFLMMKPVPVLDDSLTGRDLHGRRMAGGSFSAPSA